MQALKSFKPTPNYFSNAINFASENLVLYSLILYSITGNNNIILFVLGVVINSLMYFILKNEDYYDGKSFPSLSAQTFCFLYSFIITKKILDNTIADINILFIVMGIVIFYLLVTNENNTFPALLMGSLIGIFVGIIYSWLIFRFMKKNEEENIQIFGAPYSDYNKCDSIEEKDLPKVIEKESTRSENCI